MVTKTQVIISVAFLMAFLTAYTALAPAKYQFVTVWDLALFVGEIIVVGAACSVATGLPCAAAIGGTAALTLGVYFATNWNLLKAVLFTPLQVVIIWTLTSMGRGGGD